MSNQNVNQFLPFATGAGANVISATNYALATYLQQGFEAGTLEPYDLNTVLRQSTFIASALAQFTADYGPAAVVDDGNQANFEANYVAALRSLFVGIPDVVDQGSANQIVINPQVPASTYKVPMEFIIKVAATNVLVGGQTGATTVNVSGIGPIPLIITDGSQLLPGDIQLGSRILISYDATLNAFMLLSQRQSFPTPRQLIHYARDVSLTVNQVVIATDSSVVSYTEPTFFGVYIANTNNSPTVTFQGNSLGAIPMTRGAGSPLVAGDLVAGTVAFLCFDGTEAQVLNPQQLGATPGSASVDNIVGPIRPYWLAVNSAVVGAPPVSPSTGDTYLLPTGSTGAWTGNDGKVAQWTGTAWVYVSYPNASLVAAADVSQYFQRAGASWNEVQIMSLGRHFFFCQL